MLQASPELKKHKDKKSWKGFLKSKNGSNVTLSSKKTVSSLDKITRPIQTSPSLTRTPSFGNMVYSTPSTTPSSCATNYTSPRPEKIPNRDPFEQMEFGLNMSFANILNNNKEGLPITENKIDESKEVCFICQESLSTLFQSERILKLHCGDSVHCECFKAYFRDEITKAQELYSNGPTITFTKNCKGDQCKNSKSVILEVGNWNLISTRKLSLIPKRPAPHPKTNSINFTALKSTLNETKTPIINRNARTNNRTSVELTRSPSPNPTVSTSTTDPDIRHVNTAEADIIRNELIKFLLDNCPRINLSKLLHLGSLRLADELSVCIEPMENFQTRFVYLFENYMTVWSKNTEDLPVFIPMNEIQISSRGSILQIYQKGTEKPRSTLLQSPSSSIVEKWVVAVSEPKLQLPPDVITSTITTDYTKRRSILSSISVKSSTNQHTTNGNSITESSSEYDSETDNEIEIENQSDNESDSDVDSDAELIQKALNVNTADRWEELLIEIDNALVNI
ncbi:putative MAP-kinase scaffold protein [Candida maltosa Xu316]|uniref:Putative MAP-kinase scaffold protein n=1 Tax=Candida maltosa (strain Xu316) TaxID=1245528 RepID=M3IM46_CANMX|nr:putative MAP-kinase scaffold protein [Candida maltosa Xu316]